MLKLLIRCFFQDLVLFIGPGFSNRIETTRLDHQAYYRFLLKPTFLIIVLYSSLWPKIQDKPKKPFKKHHQVSKTSFEVQTNRHYLQLENFGRFDGVCNFYATNMTATSKQLVGYMKLFSSSRRAVMRSFNLAAHLTTTKAKSACLCV